MAAIGKGLTMLGLHRNSQKLEPRKLETRERKMRNYQVLLKTHTKHMDIKNMKTCKITDKIIEMRKGR